MMKKTESATMKIGGEIGSPCRWVHVPAAYSKQR